MNRRILKKLCKRAAPVLLARYRIVCQPDDEAMFEISSSHGWPHHEVRWSELTDSGYVDCLQGTLIHSYRCSYEYDEWDYKLAYDLLREQLAWDFSEESGEYDEYGMPNLLFPDLSTPAKVFALIKQQPSAEGE